MPSLKLYMILLGCKPPGRHVEQHDVFFGIAASLNELLPEMEDFWPEPDKLHIDAWREVNFVEGYHVGIQPRAAWEKQSKTGDSRLFFINLGGYQPFKFEEQHYMLLTVKADRAAAMKEAKRTLFFQTNHFAKATSHIDDKYGIDVDDLYEIEDILTANQKAEYRITLTPTDSETADEIHLGYLKFSALK